MMHAAARCTRSAHALPTLTVPQHQPVRLHLRGHCRQPGRLRVPAHYTGGWPCNPGLCASALLYRQHRAVALHPYRRPPTASSAPSAVGTWQCTIKPAAPVACPPSAPAPTCRRLPGPHFCSSSPAGAAAAAAAAARAGCPCCSRAGERRLLVAAWIAHGRFCMPHPALPPYACKPSLLLPPLPPAGGLPVPRPPQCMAYVPTMPTCRSTTRARQSGQWAGRKWPCGGEYTTAACSCWWRAAVAEPCM